MNLLPRDQKFFELLNKHAGIVCQASELLMSGLTSGYKGMRQISKQMELLEREGDDVIHDISDQLQATFITPIDPEDILDWSPFLRQTVKTHFSLNGELSHGIVAQAVHAGI